MFCKNESIFYFKIFHLVSFDTALQKSGGGPVPCNISFITLVLFLPTNPFCFSRADFLFESNVANKTNVTKLMLVFLSACI